MSTVTLDPTLVHAKVRVSRLSQQRLVVALIVLGDILALLAAFSIAYSIRFQSTLPFFDDVVPSSPEVHQILIPLLVLAWLPIFWLLQLYDLGYLLGGTQEYARVFNGCAIAPSLVVLVTYFDPVVRISRGWLTIAWVLAILLVCLMRFALRRVVYILRRRGWLSYRTLIVGTDEEACAIAEQVSNTPTTGAEIIGFIASSQEQGCVSGDLFPIVGTLDTLPTLVKSLGIQELIISTASLARADLINIFQTFATSDQVELRFSSGLYELFTTGVHVREVGNVPLVSMNRLRLDGFETAVKALMDRVLTFLALILLSPIFAAIAILIKLDSAGPVVYRRRVLGTGGRQFDAFKFRTMHVDGDEILARHPELLAELKANHKLKQDPRITRVGKWLRRFSLDEMPQLFNIFRGQMSLVGPRMISPEEATKYGKLWLNLLTVKPGLTGLWQVKGRSDLSYAERVRLDMYYIRNYSVWLDIQILFQTIPVVLQGRGAY
ncbi:MAG: sugar transferase [Anaerolineae bacterium]